MARTAARIELPCIILGQTGCPLMFVWLSVSLVELAASWQRLLS